MLYGYLSNTTMLETLLVLKQTLGKMNKGICIQDWEHNNLFKAGKSYHIASKSNNQWKP